MDSFRGLTVGSCIVCLIKSLDRCDLTVSGDTLIPSAVTSDAFRNYLEVEKKKMVGALPSWSAKPTDSF